MDQSNDYSPVQSNSKYQSESSHRSASAVLDNIVMKEGDWFIIKNASYKEECCLLSYFKCLKRWIKAWWFCKEWKIVFVKIADDRTKIKLNIEQKPAEEIDLKEVIGVHYDRHAEWTNVILSDSKLIVFKGFWEKDLLNLRNSIQFCLNSLSSKSRYKHTTDNDIEISEFIQKFGKHLFGFDNFNCLDQVNESNKKEKIIKIWDIITKFQIKYAYFKIKTEREETKHNEEDNINVNNIVLELDMQGSHGHEGEDSAKESLDPQPSSNKISVMHIQNNENAEVSQRTFRK